MKTIKRNENLDIIEKAIRSNKLISYTGLNTNSHWGRERNKTLQQSQNTLYFILDNLKLEEVEELSKKLAETKTAKFRLNKFLSNKETFLETANCLEFRKYSCLIKWIYHSSCRIFG